MLFRSGFNKISSFDDTGVVNEGNTEFAGKPIKFLKFNSFLSCTATKEVANVNTDKCTYDCDKCNQNSNIHKDSSQYYSIIIYQIGGIIIGLILGSLIIIYTTLTSLMLNLHDVSYNKYYMQI